MTLTDHESRLSMIMDFLNREGLCARFHNCASGFLNYVRISNGKLLVDPKCEINDLLHEAGHLAITPGQFRELVDVDADEIWLQKDVVNACSKMVPDTLFARAVVNCSDQEATAWAWAAGVYLGLSGNEIIHDFDYDGNFHYGGNGALQRLSLLSGVHSGVHGLSRAGWCQSKKNPYDPLPVYPKLTHWVQPVIPVDC